MHCAGDYSYEVTAEDCITKTGEFSRGEAKKAVTVTLDGVIGDGAGRQGHLLSTAKRALGISAQRGQQRCEKVCGRSVKLSGDIDLQNMSWTPIGLSWTSPFRGHLDGAGHTISGLNVTNARTLLRIFGCLWTMRR